MWRFPEIRVHLNHHFNGIFSLINHPFGGTTIYGNPHIYIYNESRDTKRQKTTSSSSSSSSSSSTRKSTLRHRLSQLRSECTEYLGAIFHHQQIEQENEELKTLCDSLTAENQELRAAQSKN